jgi:hypothetical protein
MEFFRSSFANLHSRFTIHLCHSTLWAATASAREHASKRTLSNVPAMNIFGPQDWCLPGFNALWQLIVATNPSWVKFVH